MTECFLAADVHFRRSARGAIVVVIEPFLVRDRLGRRLGRLQDENLNHARAVIRAWLREYNEERPKNALGGLTPAAYARQLAAKAVTSTQGL